MIVLIDNGHGLSTPGKRSPDGRIHEWAWAREAAQQLLEELAARGIEARRIVTENDDTSLTERCRRVNTICKLYGAKNCLLVSIHNNAAGSDNKWHDARGFSVFVSLNASDNSKRLARCIYNRAATAGLKGNRDVPVVRYWTQNLAICRDTNCPAVLAECLFQDNLSDVDYLCTESGKKTIVKALADGIIDYINNK